MKLSTILTSAVLALTVTANPIPESLAERIPQRVAEVNAILGRDAAAEKVGLIKRNELTCKIVNVVTTVDCRYWPTHASTWQGMKNHVVTSFKPSTKHDFACYLPGEKVGGITSWDYANNWGCFVPGLYTDSHCTHQALGLCWV